MYDSNRRKEKNQLKQTIEEKKIVYYSFLILDSVFVIIIQDK